VFRRVQRPETEAKTCVELLGEETLVKSASSTGNKPDVESGRAV
jgi:hypothetical protein